MGDISYAKSGQISPRVILKSHSIRPSTFWIEQKIHVNVFVEGGARMGLAHARQKLYHLVLQTTCEFFKDKSKTTSRKVLLGRGKVSKKGEHRVYQV